jgi:hypothetical protein
MILLNNSGAYRGLSDLWTCTQLCVAIFSMEKACGAIDIERSTTTSEANIFFGGSHDNPFQGEKASADCGHEYRQFEPNVDDNVVVGEVFKKYVDT